jgi:mannose-6-phosphate isomerase-like protein (cupin superfamily)
MERVTRQKFDLPVDQQIVSQAWRTRGYSCDGFVDPPGRSWNNFVHDSNELVTVVEGRLEMAVAGTRTILEPGDEMTIPRGAVHSVRNIHTDRTHWLYGYD